MSNNNHLMEFPVLCTNRLILKELFEQDSQALFNNISDRDVSKYLDSFGPLSVETAREAIKGWSEQFKKKEFIRWGITFKGDDTVIGTICADPCYVSFRENPLPPIMLGYDLSKEYWNNGIMTEALKSVIEFWFGKMNALRLQATVHPLNIASLKVLEKLGFEKEGALKKYSYHTGYGEFQDRVILALINDNYMKPYLGAK
jgi:ribosomal-protein-alanine N-acetyltransferase